MKSEKIALESDGDDLPLMTSSPRPSPNGNNAAGDNLPLLQLIGKQVQETPGNLALRAGDESLSYGELELRSNQLAHRLRSLGVGPETIVAICLPRSPNAVVSALAVMKAGGAYLPLDQEYPVARLHFMLRDAGVRLLITEDRIGRTLRSGEFRVFSLPLELAKAEGQPSQPPEVLIDPENLAYVIYTSGSSGGEPKAALIPHRALLNLIGWHRRAFSIGAADRASQIASLGFDAAVWEIWPYLASGASVHFPDDSTRGTASSLRDWLVQEEITVCFAPTALAENLLKLDWPAEPPLRLLLTGADVLHRFPPPDLPFTLVNNYGPTECAVVTTFGKVPADPKGLPAPSIGSPIDNVQVYILDENLQQVPAGTVGEIYVGGAGLARGYLNRPEREAAAFVANPFAGAPGERLYRTGDLARYLADGQIAFVGRTDDQIKIRGFRIEPGEIVGLLNQYPGIHESAVISQGVSDGERRLMAYVASSDAGLTATALREYLRKQLPDYMIPGIFVRIQSLPLNSSGKLDRAALPAPTSANMLGEDTYVAPRTPIEDRMVSILAELLSLERVGVNDNFFFLGGHSLLGTQLIARVRSLFGVELSLRKVFDSPTAAELSEEIERLLSSQPQISAD